MEWLLSNVPPTQCFVSLPRSSKHSLMEWLLSNVSLTQCFVALMCFSNLTDAADKVTHRRPPFTDNGLRTDVQDPLHKESLRSDHPCPAPLRSADVRTCGPFGQPPAAMPHADSSPIRWTRWPLCAFKLPRRWENIVQQHHCPCIFTRRQTANS
jgi:hypothetical protein